MDKKYLKKNLEDIKNITATMLENIDDINILKFFAGKLAISTKEITSLLMENN